MIDNFHKTVLLDSNILIRLWRRSYFWENCSKNQQMSSWWYLLRSLLQSPRLYNRRHHKISLSTFWSAFSSLEEITFWLYSEEREGEFVLLSFVFQGGYICILMSMYIWTYLCFVIFAFFAYSHFVFKFVWQIKLRLFWAVLRLGGDCWLSIVWRSSPSSSSGWHNLSGVLTSWLDPEFGPQNAYVEILATFATKMP